MCESKVYLNSKKILDEVILITAEGDDLVIVGLLGERKEVKNARITKMDMDRHEVWIVSNDE
jgi:predicted RNA-binding protein